jgi:hypothetical protein
LFRRPKLTLSYSAERKDGRIGILMERDTVRPPFKVLSGSSRFEN